MLRQEGKKTARIPEWLFENQELLKNCVRGLIDTDGGIFRKDKKGNRYIVDFKSTNPMLLADARKALEMLGFTVSRSGPYSIRIQVREEVKQYLKKIGTSNNKNTYAINQILHQ
ncbi:MAG: LAGLIDADG family homing endonuclease [Candidatus Woesearchaeota archaeon]